MGVFGEGEGGVRISWIPPGSGREVLSTETMVCLGYVEERGQGEGGGVGRKRRRMGWWGGGVPEPTHRHFQGLDSTGWPTDE